MKERLQKLLAQANVASRRASEELISRGRVRVNGKVAQVGDKADPEVDVIEVDGTRLNFAHRERIFIALNKPKHVLTTDKPHRGDTRQTVSDLIGRDEHLFSIGRLDADSEGLVVMTNDGETAQRLSHPRYRHTKTYRVDVFGLPTAETLEKWQQGIFLEEGKTAPCIVEIVKGSVKGTTLRIVMTEGKKRQIRRVAAALGHPVDRLVRTHIGMFAMTDLPPGASRELTQKEILALSTPSPEIKRLRAETTRRSDKTAPEPKSRVKLPTAPKALDDDARRARRPKPPAFDEDEPSERQPQREPRHRAASPTGAPVAPDADKRRTPQRQSRSYQSDSVDEQSERPPRKPRSRSADSPDIQSDRKQAENPAGKPYKPSTSKRKPSAGKPRPAKSPKSRPSGKKSTRKNTPR